MFNNLKLLYGLNWNFGGIQSMYSRISHTITRNFLCSERYCFHKIAAHTHWKHYISACPKGLKQSDIDNNKQSSMLRKQVCILPALAEPQNGLT